MNPINKNSAWLEEKKIFMFIYLESKLGSNLNLQLTIKLVKFKPNNVFVNKIVCMIFNLNIKIYYMFTWIKVHLYRLEI